VTRRRARSGCSRVSSAEQAPALGAGASDALVGFPGIRVSAARSTTRDATRTAAGKRWPGLEVHPAAASKRWNHVIRVCCTNGCQLCAVPKMHSVGCGPLRGAHSLASWPRLGRRDDRSWASSAPPICRLRSPEASTGAVCTSPLKPRL
jgi:hypothetical protein